MKELRTMTIGETIKVESGTDEFLIKVKNDKDVSGVSKALNKMGVGFETMHPFKSKYAIIFALDVKEGAKAFKELKKTFKGLEGGKSSGKPLED